MRLRRFALGAAAALAAVVGGRVAEAQLTLSLQNHTCGELMISLVDAPGCGPNVPACSVLARNGFTTRLQVGIAYRPGFLTLSGEGGCNNRNTRIAGTCQIEVKTVRERVPLGLSIYRDDTGRPEGQSIGPPYGYPYHDLELSIPRPASLIHVDIYQGICDTDRGERRCELFCRASDQQ